MHYTSTLETLECIWKSLFMCSAHRVGALAILYPLVEVSSTGISSWEGKMCLVNSQSIIKHAKQMDYTSTLETLEGFWMTLSWCFEHQVKPLAILYPLVKVSNPGNSSWWSTLRLVNSQSIIEHAI